jgi:serine/threonine protein kinase
MDDDALSDWIAADAQALLRARQPVELSRYLTACPALPKHQVALDTAIEMTLQSMVQQDRGALPACMDELSARHPDLADRIRIAAELSAAMNSTSLFRVITQFVGPVPVPSDFGPPMPDGRARYELLELLGQGSEGAVYRAADRLMSDPSRPAWVAVKMLSDRSAGTHRRLARHDEAIRARRVNHPNVIRAIDRGTWDQIPYAVFEYVEGDRLDTLTGSRRPSPARAAELVRQIAYGLQAIHSAGLIHCDLKPANVLIDTNGLARIADFGLAQYQPQHARESADAAAPDESHGYGTLAFVAPEQFRRLPGCLAPPADIYALGGLLYWLLTGCTPNGATVELARRRLARETSEPDEPMPFAGFDVPPDLVAICRRALASDPAARYPSAAMLAEDLRAFLGLRPLAWNNPSFWHRTRLLARREPWKLGLAGVALVAGVTTVSAITWSINQRHVIRMRAALETARHEARAVEADLRAENERMRRERIDSVIEATRRSLTLGDNLNYAEGWLPLLNFIEAMSGMRFVGAETEDALWRLRLDVAQNLMLASEQRGGKDSLEYRQWQLLKGVWCLQSGLSGDAVSLTQEALDGYAKLLPPTDPWLRYVRTLRDAAIAVNISADELRADPQAYVPLRDALGVEAVELAKSRPRDPARAICLRALVWLTDPENGGHPRFFARWYRELKASNISPPRPPTSAAP